MSNFNAKDSQYWAVLESNTKKFVKEQFELFPKDVLATVPQGAIDDLLTSVVNTVALAHELSFESKEDYEECLMFTTKFETEIETLSQVVDAHLSKILNDFADTYL